MLPLAVLARVFWSRLAFPVALVVGAIGYTIESKFAEKRIAAAKPFQEIRSERALKELEETDPAHVQSLKEKRYSNALDRNLSPSLS